MRGVQAGPTLIVVGGIHGNEPAGVEAARRVCARLTQEQTPIRGDIWAFAGNLKGLAQGRRYLSRDLNRNWSRERVAAGGTDDAEAAEQRELAAALAEALAAARGRTYFVDLHTTSAEGIAFGMVGDTLPHRAFATHFPLPVILGLEEQVDGVLTEYMTGHGCSTLVVEGGQNDNPESVANLEATLWLAVAASGVAARSELPAWAGAWERLERVRGSLPRLVNVVSRHAVRPEDAFRMEPGFANIHRVRAGQLLARDRRGEILAPRDGLILLPLYQAQGEDGFFFGHEVGELRQGATTWARRARLDVLLPLLPGVHRLGEDRLALGARAAAVYPADLFQFFGYWTRRATGSGWALSRRPSP